MISLSTRARAPLVPGRRVFCARRSITVTLLTSILTACTTVGAGPAETNLRAGPVDPPIRIEASGPIQDPTATRLLRAAEAALDSDPTEAERLAQEVVRAHAAATGSSGALRILARLDYAQGSWESAEAFAVQYAALLPAGDDRAVVMRTLAGDAVLADGRPVDALNHWLTTPADADASLILGVLQRVEGAVEGLASDDLQRVLDDGAGPTPLWGAVAAHLALERYIEGDRETAVRLGQAAVDAGATGESARMARGVVSGDVSEFVFVPRIGMVLPTSGSPRLRDFADEILQGVQVAISQYGQATGSRLAVELVQRDNQGVVGNGLRIIFDGNLNDLMQTTPGKFNDIRLGRRF